MARSSILVQFAGALILALNTAAASTPAPPAVSVTYDHPERFAETKEVRAFAPARADSDYLGQLKRYIEQRAGRLLANGQQLQIVITDIDRAGSFEPWRGPRLSDVRIIKDIYPPRIDLRFRLLDANGKVIREGQRRLRDLAFLSGNTAPIGTDSLRYEKNLIDRWLRRGPDNL
jgi:hypothetical protein